MILASGSISVSRLRPWLKTNDHSFTIFEDAFDVISKVTWSEPLGFLRKGSDIDDLIRTLETDMDYNAPVRNSAMSIPKTGFYGVILILKLIDWSNPMA